MASAACRGSEKLGEGKGSAQAGSRKPGGGRASPSTLREVLKALHLGGHVPHLLPSYESLSDHETMEARRNARRAAARNVPRRAPRDCAVSLIESIRTRFALAAV